MTKIVCTPFEDAVTELADFRYRLFNRPTLPGMGTAGPTLFKDLERFKVTPAPRAWDLLGIALSVGAADEACLRVQSPDGWTREIDLTIAVHDVEFWDGQKNELEAILRFLTGDIWQLRFLSGGATAPKPKEKRTAEEDCVCLLSGGADSLAGAIDVVANNKPLLVSQISKGDKANQRLFALKIAGPQHHLQLNHNINVPGLAERSQRSRSLLFIAYGVLGCTCLASYADGASVTLYIPENGFISLNVPLTPLRLGSLSTRTTHPFYLGMLQHVLNAAGLQVRLVNPYQLRTKGELLGECQNQTLLKQLVCQSTSCGRYARMGFKHCGRCVPCIVRRSAFLAIGLDDTTNYVFRDLSIKDKDHANFDDVRSAAFAVQQVVNHGMQSWVGCALSTMQLGDTTNYAELLSRGIAEIAAFLRNQRVL